MIAQTPTPLWFQDEQHADPEDSTSASSSYSGVQIMIVDDEPINVKVARRYLAAAGFESITECSDET